MYWAIEISKQMSTNNFWTNSSKRENISAQVPSLHVEFKSMVHAAGLASCFLYHMSVNECHSCTQMHLSFLLNSFSFSF